jgi:hypothetical protein
MPRILGFDTKAIVLIAQSTNAQSIPNGSATVVTTWSELTDTASAFNPTTGVFTAPQAGNYLVSAMIPFNANGSGVRNLEVRKNGSGTYAVLDRQNGIASDGNYLKGTTIVNCAAGDTISITATQTSGGALSLQGVAIYQRLEIHRISE